MNDNCPKKKTHDELKEVVLDDEYYEQYKKDIEEFINKKIDFIENKGLKINYTHFHNQFNLLNKMPSLKDNQKRKIIRTRHFIEYLVAGGETPYSEANRIKNNIYMNQDILLLKFNLFNNFLKIIDQ